MISSSEIMNIKQLGINITKASKHVKESTKLFEDIFLFQRYNLVHLSSLQQQSAFIYRNEKSLISIILIISNKSDHFATNYNERQSVTNKHNCS